MALSDCQPHDRSSYELIAPYYDWIMLHVDYKSWAQYLRSTWKKHHLSPTRILELGAGTCPFVNAGLFADNTFSVHTDLSPSMLYQTKTESNLRLAAVNSAALPFRTSFDLCLMIYDAINYLTEPRNLEASLLEVYRVLQKDGLFIFDITTEYNSKTFFLDTVDYDEKSDCTIIRHSWYDQKVRLQYNDFIYFIDNEDNCYQKCKETHIQRIYSMREMEAAIRKTGFQLLGCYDNFSFKQATKRSERIHYVLRK